MIVSGSPLPGVLKVYGEQAKARRAAYGETAAAADAADRVDLSPKAQEFSGLLAKLRQTPEVRSEVVDRLSAQVEAGEYRVDARAVARRLLAGPAGEE